MTQETSIKQTAITEQDIAEYLQEHPDFFIKQQELLRSLRIPHASGKSISLLEHQVNRLRSHNQELQTQLSLLLDNARSNDLLFKKTQQLVLDLITATSLENLTTTLENHLRTEFKVDAISFIILQPTASPIGAGRKATVEEAHEKLGSLIAGHTITTGKLRENAIVFLFGKNTLINSIALAPLRKEQLLGVLALGSHQQNRYHKETGTLFLEQIRDILCLLLPRFLTD